MTFLTAAFVVVWLLVTIYLVYMGQRQRSLENEMRSLEEALADRGQKTNR